MNYLLRSFQISFVVHAAALLLLAFFGDRYIFPEKVLVIDFTIEDSGGRHNPDNEVMVRPQTPVSNIMQKANEKGEENARPFVETAPSLVSPVTVNPLEPMSAELQMPVSVLIETAETPDGDTPNTAAAYPAEGSSAISVKETGAIPGRGPGNFDDAGKARYLKANFSYIKDLINRHITYPETARQMGWQGKVKISFFVASDGDAKGIKIVESSGIMVLDKSAVEAVKSASPFPKPPVEAQIIIPILYQLR